MKNLVIQFLIMVSVGTLIGWFTNYLAIKLLFRPYKEVNLLFFKIQGLIPKRRDEIAVNISEVVEKELISLDDIAEKFQNSEFSEEMIDELLDKIIGEKLQKSILEKNPLLKMLINDSMIEKIISEIIKIAKEKIDFKEIMLSKMQNFSLKETEDIILRISKKELKHIEIIGGILGGIIAVFQFFVMLFVKQI